MLKIDAVLLAEAFHTHVSCQNRKRKKEKKADIWPQAILKKIKNRNILFSENFRMSQVIAPINFYEDGTERTINLI